MLLFRLYRRSTIIATTPESTRDFLNNINNFFNFMPERA